MKVRNALALFAATVATTVTGTLVSTAPVHAVDEGLGIGTGMNVVSPDLIDKFPCGDASTPALDSFLNYLGLGGQPSYSCHGTLYSTIIGGLPNVAALSGAGVDTSTGEPYSFSGVGNYGGGTYTYSEPCQVSPIDGSRSSGTGESEGTLTLNLTGAGFIGAAPITAATVVVDFKWSRVGFNAIIGLNNIRLTANGVTVHDTVSKGVATAVFIPQTLPDCNAPQDEPVAGNINIISGTLSI